MDDMTDEELCEVDKLLDDDGGHWPYRGTLQALAVRAMDELRRRRAAQATRSPLAELLPVDKGLDAKAEKLMARTRGASTKLQTASAERVWSVVIHEIARAGIRPGGEFILSAGEVSAIADRVASQLAAPTGMVDTDDGPAVKLGAATVRAPLSLLAESEASPPNELEITELRLCESSRLILCPDRLYRFTVDLECKLCLAMEEAGRR